MISVLYFSELAPHVDGFIAAVAHTIVVGASKDNKVTGRVADVLMAGHLASEIAYRMVVPGGEVSWILVLATVVVISHSPILLF
jgi:methionine aminopeptidase